MAWLGSDGLILAIHSGYEHFSRKRDFSWGTKVNMYVLGSIGCTGLAIYVSNLESIPYTNRRHSLLLSAAREKSLGIQNFQEVDALLRSFRKLLLDYCSDHRRFMNRS